MENLSEIHLQISEEEKNRLIEILTAKKGYQYYTISINARVLNESESNIKDSEWSEQTNFLSKDYRDNNSQ